MKKKICIANYGCGNTQSIKNAFKFLNYNAIVSNKSEDILEKCPEAWLLGEIVSKTSNQESVVIE